MKLEIFGISMGSIEFSWEALSGAFVLILLIILTFRIYRKKTSQVESQSQDQFAKWKHDSESTSATKFESGKNEREMNGKSADEEATAQIYKDKGEPEDIEVSFSLEEDSLEDGETILMKACMEDQPDLVQELLNEGVDMEVPGKGGRTALMYACVAGSMDCALELIEHGANINIRDGIAADNTPLMYAAQYAMFDLINLLIKKGANINDANKDGHTALFFAGMAEDLDVFGLLIAKGGDVNARDENGRTPHIFLSAQSGNREFVKLLLDHGANINDRDFEDRTALQIAACAEGDVETIEMLLERGADVALADDGGYTPLVCAKEKKNQPVIDLLIRYGAV